MEREELAALTMPAGLTGGMGAATSNTRVSLRPAPSETATLAGPGLAISAAGTAAVNCVRLTNVVLSRDPFHTTAAVLLYPLPVTVSVKEGPPEAAEDGLKLKREGTSGVMVKGSEVEPLNRN
jgi:hypothetical protein